MGFLGINVPAALGGLGLGNIEALVVLEEFAKISSAVAFPIFESSVGPVRAIEHFAPPVLRDRIVPMVCRGEMVIAVSMSEPEAGSASWRVPCYPSSRTASRPVNACQRSIVICA